MISYEKTMIYYYIGSYGSTIRINVKSMKWLMYFKECINELVNGKIQTIAIECMENVEIVDFETLTLKKVQNRKFPKIEIQKINDTNHFIWSQDIDELKTIIDLIIGLFESNKSGHQYLADDENEIILILSYME